MSASLAPMDHTGRLTALMGAVATGEVDEVEALVVTNRAHIRYLTAFQGSAGILLVGANSATLVTDNRYADVGGEVVAGLGDAASIVVGDQKTQLEALRSLGKGLERVGVEAESMTLALATTVAADWFPDAEVIATKGVVEAMRLTKDDAEIQRIERAAAITDNALGEVCSLLGSGLSERSFAVALDRAIIDGGADDLSFQTIVASGPNGARPHHVPGDRKIENGDLVIVDVGALVDGYHSDMTRTFSVGTVGADAEDMMDVVTAAQAAGVAAVGIGVTGDDVDVAARDVISDAGLGEYFVHGVGHGVGLDIHEAPFLLGSDLPLREGQVVTVEPGVYRSEVGGVRVEDTVVVTADGCRPLTRSPKDPSIALS